MRIGAIGACLVAIAGVAHADQAAPQEPISAATAKVARVANIALGATTHVVLVEWTDVTQQATQPATQPNWTVVVPYDPTTCDRTFAIVSDAKAWKVGARTRDLWVPGRRPGSSAGATLPWCMVGDDVAGTTSLPSLHDLLAAEGDALLPGLGKLYDFFGKPGEPTPFDDTIDGALGELESDAALQLAIDHHRYWMASEQYHWRTDPKHFDVVERAVWRDAHPDFALVRLLWQLSPARAAARIRDAYAKDPAPAFELAALAPPWDEAIDLQIGSAGLERAAGRVGATALLSNGNERARDFLVAERVRITEPMLRDMIDQQLAKFDDRAKLGITDAIKLAQYMRQHPDDADRFTGMRLAMAGPTSIGCDLRLPLAGYDVVLKADCDAETLQRSFTRPGGAPIIVTGNVRTVYRGDDYVEISLEEAHVVDGYAAPPAATIDAAPAPAPDANGTFDVEAPAKKRHQDGGCCGAGGDGGIVLAPLVLLGLRRRRR